MGRNRLLGIWVSWEKKLPGGFHVDCEPFMHESHVLGKKEADLDSTEAERGSQKISQKFHFLS